MNLTEPDRDVLRLVLTAVAMHALIGLRATSGRGYEGDVSLAIKYADALLTQLERQNET